jgi:DNA-binding MarR family transcriptional regulator
MPTSLSQRAWKWIEQRPDFMPNELARELEISPKETRRIIDHLVRRHYLRARNTTTKPYVYEKIEGVEANFSRNRPNPHPSTNSRQRIWQALRWGAGNRTTVADLVGSTNVAASNVNRYLSSLTKYGYVSRVRAAKGGQPAIYRLIKQTGHQYPQITNRGLYDPNTKQLVTPQEVKK